MTIPLISVIVPVYNVANYLPRCLDSICNQTYQNLEIILVDDGSTDNSLEICKAYANKDKRIVVIHQQNAGVSAARNAGLNKSKGDFISFVDSDDWLDTRFYQQLRCAQEQTNADLVWGKVVPVHTERPPALTPSTQGPSLLSLEDFFVASCRKKDFFLWNKLFSRAVIRHPFIVGRRLAEDWDFLFKNALQAQQIVYTQHAVYFYYQRADSAVHTLSVSARNQAFETWKNAYETCLKINLVKASQPLLHTTYGAAGVLAMTIILQPDLRPWGKLLQQTIGYLRLHQETMRNNKAMGLPGKLFIKALLLMPRVLPTLCRIPGIRFVLRKIFIKRIVS